MVAYFNINKSPLKIEYNKFVQNKHLFIKVKINKCAVAHVKLEFILLKLKYILILFENIDSSINENYLKT